MPNPTIHFERVPLEVVKKLAEKEPPPTKNDQTNPGIKIRQKRSQSMTDGELKFPQWQSSLQELLLEFDREELNEKVQKMEALIAKRFQELQQGSDGRVEQQALFDALTILRVIKRDKLGFPDWK